MATGKSTVGRLLADELGWYFVDLDEQIEQAAGSSISHVFETQGEAVFRQMEHERLTGVVRKVESGKPHVVALGGGAFAQDNNYQLLENNGVTIWLDCPLEVLERRVARAQHRPLARDLERFRSLYQARREAYAKADYRIEVGDADATVHVQSIMKLPLF
jgi:shikimate kinase